MQSRKWLFQVRVPEYFKDICYLCNKYRGVYGTAAAPAKVIRNVKPTELKCRLK